MVEIKIFALACVSLGVCLFCTHLAEAQSKQSLDAWIDTTKKEDGILVVRPMCRAERPLVVDYFLVAIKEGSAGVSMNSQSGKTSLTPRTEKMLCEFFLWMEPDSTCRLRLEISYRGRKLITKELLVTENDFKNPI